MEAILLAIYSFFVWLIFIKFKWLPWNTTSQVTEIHTDFCHQQRNLQPLFCQHHPTQQK